MPAVLALITARLLGVTSPDAAQDARATLEAAAKALGADVKSIDIRTCSRAINYETASPREERVRDRRALNVHLLSYVSEAAVTTCCK
ncbi:MAG TPA: hypothetical protein VJX92_06845 [Methylomirabilota bacterium]|nr:hypothetical protein [Methylomirabilota bacterium]